MDYAIGQVAAFARVSVRTLRHYDQIGLLHPSGRSQAGYRQYALSDLERLHRILCYRNLGLPLERIQAVLDDPATNPLDHLRRQHTLVSELIEELGRMRAAVETLLEARTIGITLEPHEILEAFGETNMPEQHEEAEQSEEAEQRWGANDACATSLPLRFAESRQRTHALQPCVAAACSARCPLCAGRDP